MPKFTAIFYVDVVPYVATLYVNIWTNFTSFSNNGIWNFSVIPNFGAKSYNSERANNSRLWLWYFWKGRKKFIKKNTLNKLKERK